MRNMLPLHLKSCEPTRNIITDEDSIYILHTVKHGYLALDTSGILLDAGAEDQYTGTWQKN